MVAWSHVLVQSNLGEAMCMVGEVCDGGGTEGVCDGGGMGRRKHRKCGGNEDWVRPLKPLTSFR